MPWQIITIGPVPCLENAAQVGHPDYEEHSRSECHVFKRMLERLHAVPADCPATLTVKSFMHDFGVYREVCVRYDDSNAAATDYAYGLESHTPTQWDAIARYELIWLERLGTLNHAVRSGQMRQEQIPAIYRSQQPPALPTGQPFEELVTAFPL
jgi:hypothetical protein